MSSAPELRPERIPNVPPTVRRGHVCRPFLFCRRCWGIAFACHALVLAAIILFVPSGSDPLVDRPLVMSMAPTIEDMPRAEMLDEAFEEESEDIYEADVNLEEPVIRDEEIKDQVRTDNDLEHVESFGESAGLSDAPFEGPSNNGTIGIGGGAGAFGGRARGISDHGGGGAGGRFRGRGGSRDIGHGGGGRARWHRSQETKSTWKRSHLTPNRMRLKLGVKEELPLASLRVRATVEGFRARVVMECEYDNPHRRRQLEGTFQWRLPDGATPYYLAFGHLAGAVAGAAKGHRGPLATDLASLRDTNRGATMKEARIVPRAKAARAYTETVRRRIDPALMEWAGAGVFQTRVFPLRPNQRHRITVGYEVNLQPHGDEQVFELFLPEAADVSADLAVREVTSDGSAAWSSRSYHNPKNLPLAVSVPNLGATLLRGGGPDTFHTFAAQLTPDLPKACGHAGSPRALYLLDTSASSAASFETWLDLLEVHLETNRDSIHEFAVGFFNIEAYGWRDGFVANTSANVGAFLAHARQQVLEGASDLGAALTLAGGHAGQFDCFVMSEGAATWGERDPTVLATKLGADRRCFAYRGIAASTDGAALAALTRATNGAVFTVADDDLEGAAKAHRCAFWTLKDVRVAGGHDVVVRGSPRHLYPGQTLYVAGRGRPLANASVDVVLESAGGEHVVRVPTEQAFESELATSTYGQIAVETLEGFGPVVGDTARAYALHFRSVGKTCSLLMLDSERDYQRFKIEPEKDSEIVKLTRMRELLGRIERESVDALLDPKARFLSWLDGLARTQGRHAKVRPLAANLPSEAFVVPAESLRCELRSREALSDAHRALLAATAPEPKASEAVARALSVATPADALRLYSSAVERNPGDPVVARGTAFAARALGFPGHAHHLLTRALRARPFESQSYLAVARCLADAGKLDLAHVHFELAWQLTRSRQIVALHYLRFLRKAGERLADERWAERLPVLRNVAGLGEADLVVTLLWNTDRTDVDMHVQDPARETCSYENQTTKMGGRITRDIQQGYGPEMFTLAKAKAGRYVTLANMFSSDARRLSTGTRIWLTTIEDFGRPSEVVRHRQIWLGDARELIEIDVLTRKAP